MNPLESPHRLGQLPPYEDESMNPEFTSTTQVHNQQSMDVTDVPSNI
jgi:hypothetical protein